LAAICGTGSEQYSDLSGSGGWLAADVKSRVSDLSSTEQAEFFGSNRSTRLLAYIMGLEQPFDSWSALRQPIAWVVALALLVRQSPWRRESLGPLLGVASQRLDTRTTVPSIAQLGSQRFPVMHWEFAKRTVNTSVVD
jgi:hypothetical protein